jgi:hypothetical protein
MLVDIVTQFQVETAKRYAAADGKTFCNIFVWDVTRALGCELPHWWLSKELSANGLSEWLKKQGEMHGWSRASELEARGAAEKGLPAIAIWVNPDGGSGHVAVLVPSADPTKTEIAQAGLANFSRGSLERGFGPRHASFHIHA